MADTLKRLALGALTGTTEQTLYTVPASNIGVVRHLRLSNSTAAPVNVSGSIGADAIGTRIIPGPAAAATGFTLAANGTLDITGLVVLNAAETLRFIASAANAVTVYAGGIEITPVPSSDVVTRFALATVNNTATTLYTAPGGSTPVIRHIRLVNSTANAVTVVMSIGADAIGTRILPTGYQIQAYGTYDLTGSIVLNAADTLQATASAASAVTAYVGGVV